MTTAIGTRIGPLRVYRVFRPGHGLIVSAFTAYIQMIVFVLVVGFWICKAMLVLLYVAAVWTVHAVAAVHRRREVSSTA